MRFHGFQMWIFYYSGHHFEGVWPLERWIFLILCSFSTWIKNWHKKLLLANFLDKIKVLTYVIYSHLIHFLKAKCKKNHKFQSQSLKCTWRHPFHTKSCLNANKWITAEGCGGQFWREKHFLSKSQVCSNPYCAMTANPAILYAPLCSTLCATVYATLYETTYTTSYASFCAALYATMYAAMYTTMQQNCWIKNKMWIIKSQNYDYFSSASSLQSTKCQSESQGQSVSKMS